MHIWIQIEKSKNIDLYITFCIIYLGRYEYTNNYRKVIFEYHVDTIPDFQKTMTDNFFVENLSVTMGLGVQPLI